MVVGWGGRTPVRRKEAIAYQIIVGGLHACQPGGCTAFAFYFDPLGGFYFDFISILSRSARRISILFRFYFDLFRSARRTPHASIRTLYAYIRPYTHCKCLNICASIWLTASIGPARASIGPPSASIGLTSASIWLTSASIGLTSASIGRLPRMSRSSGTLFKRTTLPPWLDS